MTTTTEVGDPALRRGLLAPTVFGFGWLMVGFSGFAGYPGALIWCLPAVLLALGVHELARRALASREPRPRRTHPDARRRLGQINGGQAILIVAAIFGLARAGVPALIFPAIALIVGLHFLPLGYFFDVPGFYALGGLLIAVSVAGFLPYGMGAGAGPIRAIVGFGAAASLWGSSLVIAKRG
jgi:hypothetical protein